MIVCIKFRAKIAHHFAKMWQHATKPKIMMERTGKKIYAIFWHNATIFLHLERTIIKFSCYGNCCHTEQKKRRVAMENQNIKKRVRRLVESLGWSVQPSGTWCRHSFATNLTHAGVPHNYISESMDHAVDNNITNRYIDAYPLSQQMAFNSKLLKLNDEPDIMEELKDLTPEQLKALIAMVKNA